MEQLITIRTTDLNKLKSILAKNQLEYEIVEKLKPTKKRNNHWLTQLIGKVLIILPQKKIQLS